MISDLCLGIEMQYDCPINWNWYTATAIKRQALLFIIYHLSLFIIYYLLFIIYYLLFIIYHLLFIIHCSLFIIQAADKTSWATAGVSIAKR